MILYHGTNTDFQQIRLDMSRVGKDFGYGFYLTTDIVKQIVKPNITYKRYFFKNLYKSVKTTRINSL